MSNNTIVIKSSGSLIDEFAADAARRSSVPEALEHWIAQGKLGALAKELSHLAEELERVYTPPARQAKAERHEALAKSVNDRELAAYHKARAQRARSQMGEDRHE
jgi:hypothetical protein